MDKVCCMLKTKEPDFLQEKLKTSDEIGFLMCATRKYLKYFLFTRWKWSTS